MPPTQLCPIPHTTPHAPQLNTVFRDDSHPVNGFPSQLPNPGLQATIWHVPLSHALVAFGAMQLRPHAPQLFMLLKMLVSHPSAGFPLQLANPIKQNWIWHVPIAQKLTALGAVHVWPHAPQFCTSVRR
jgi:hypothetical protein